MQALSVSTGKFRKEFRNLKTYPVVINRFLIGQNTLVHTMTSALTRASSRLVTCLSAASLTAIICATGHSHAQAELLSPDFADNTLAARSGLLGIEPEKQGAQLPSNDAADLLSFELNENELSADEQKRLRELISRLGGRISLKTAQKTWVISLSSSAEAHIRSALNEFRAQDDALRRQAFLTKRTAHQKFVGFRDESNGVAQASQTGSDFELSGLWALISKFVDFSKTARLSSPVAIPVAANSSLATSPTAQTGPISASERFVVTIVDDSERAYQSVIQAIKAAQFAVLSSSRARKVLHISGSRNALDSVAELSNVAYIEPWASADSDLNIVRKVGGADAIESEVPWYTGIGVTAEVLDEGLRTTHAELSDVLINNGNGYNTYHGTAVYGLMFSDGAHNDLARGVLPDANGVFSTYNQLYDRYEHTRRLVDPEGTIRAVLQSNSWGNGTSTDYNSFAAELDDIVFDHDLLILHSQGNTADNAGRPQGWAKNSVSVGGVYHYNTVDTSDDEWGWGASIGPAQDGRVKPDLVHFFDQVLSTSDEHDYAYENFGGTSASTPISAGFFGLLFQMWADGIFTGEGEPGSGGDVFDARPKAATAKALMINSAEQYYFSGQDHAMNRMRQGWGLTNVKHIYNAAKNHGWKLPLVIDEDIYLQQGQTREFSIDVATAGEYFKATLAYTDPAAAPYSGKTLVNDLDLKITSPSGRLYKGNYGLLQGNWSSVNGDFDNANNIENVFIQAAEAGRYTVEVIARDIAIDAHADTARLDAPFSLVITCGGVQGCSGNNDSRLAQDTLELTSAPASIPLNGKVSTDIAFRAGGKRQLVLEVFNEEWQWLGMTTQTVYAGAGHQTLVLQLNNPKEIDKTKRYRLKVSIRPFDNFDKQLDSELRSNLAFKDIEETIVMDNVPALLNADGNLSVDVDVRLAQDRDIAFEVFDSNWNWLGGSRTRLTAEQVRAKVDVKVNGLARGSYYLKVAIWPLGGNYTQEIKASYSNPINVANYDSLPDEELSILTLANQFDLSGQISAEVFYRANGEKDLVLEIFTKEWRWIKLSRKTVNGDGSTRLELQAGTLSPGSYQVKITMRDKNGDDSSSSKTIYRTITAN